MKIEDIKNKIKSYFHSLASGREDDSLHVEIIDDSYKHQHHVEMKKQRVVHNAQPVADIPQLSHLRIKIRSKIFDNMKMVDRHKLMHKVLEDEYKTIHSISFDLA